jgi:fructan beta-fructosidase
MKNLYRCLAVCLLIAASPLRAADRDDILIADFEGDDYGTWKSTGTAFGNRPARGTLAGQMPVSGFLGKGLVNSFLGGDDALGRLTSPEFQIERRNINFLIGGGKHPGQTCINLIVDGKVARTASGPNGVPGGSERLDWDGWDVAELEGKSATIEIVDDLQGGWGHINIDQIVQSDRAKRYAPANRELVVAERYLHIPVKTGGSKVRMKIYRAGKTLDKESLLREFEVELADGQADFQTFCDLEQWHGTRVTVEVDRLPYGSKALDGLHFASSVPSARELYNERDRPQLHFSSRRGWLNDPNGLVYAGGQWHLFYQHNPYGWAWGNMHWGHATSSDLFHWKELPIALYPPRYDDMAFSGSAVVDLKNTSGWKKGDGDLLVAAFTSTARGECIVYSNDAGKTWTEFEGNPVVKHAGRDPKLIWHEPSQAWVMAVYDEFENKQWIAFHTSKDFKTWQFQSRIEGFFECPDLFEMPVLERGDAARQTSKWVIYAADGKYRLGQFDGKKFIPETDKLQLWHGNFYAAQTYSDAPENRRVQIGWGNGIEFKGMPFNQQMVLPVELTLRTTIDGPRLFAEPVRELAGLENQPHRLNNVKLVENENPLAALQGELLRITAEIEPGQAEYVGFSVRGVGVRYDVQKQQITCRHVTAPLPLVGGVVKLEIIVDRGSIEVFGNGGRVALSVGGVLAPEERSIKTEVQGTGAKLRNLKITELKSAWR